MKICAIDPGGTSGYVLSEVIHGEPLTTLEHTIGEIDLSRVWDMLTSYKPDIIVIEKFSYRNSRNKVDLTAVEVIGVVREWCRQTDVDLYFQTPSQAKHFFTDDRLREGRAYNKGMPHANDAMRHLFFFLEFGKGKGFAKRTYA